MKILTIDTNCTADFDPSDENCRWSPELQAAYDEADIVLGLFSPHSHLILKGPADLEVIDARDRIGGKWILLEGSADEEKCAAENDKLLGKA